MPACGGLTRRQPPSWSPRRAARQIRTVPAGVTPVASTASGVTARSVTVALAALTPGLNLSDLSMGMSDDFEIAIREGATIVRIGSALWEGIE